MFNGTVVTAYKLLYGWGTININVWLPSLCELIGIDPNNYADGLGTYYSAMQGLNTNTSYYVDTKGGEQFAYFKQYNTSGGGTAIMNACSEQKSWLRSPPCWRGDTVWCIINANALYTNPATNTNTNAVHPAFSSTNGIWHS